jgi:hypothetical protein
MMVMHTEETQIVMIILTIMAGNIKNYLRTGKKMYGGSAKDYAPGQRKKYYRYDD